MSGQVPEGNPRTDYQNKKDDDIKGKSIWDPVALERELKSVPVVSCCPHCKARLTPTSDPQTQEKECHTCRAKLEVLEQALRMHKQDIAVLPLISSKNYKVKEKDRGISPCKILLNWRGLSMPTEEDIVRWFGINRMYDEGKYYPNIGIRTGKISRCIALNFANDEAGIGILKALDGIGEKLSDALLEKLKLAVHHYGNRSSTVLFRISVAPGGISSASTESKGVKITLQGNGGYVVIAPSQDVNLGRFRQSVGGIIPELTKPELEELLRLFGKKLEEEKPPVEYDLMVKNAVIVDSFLAEKCVLGQGMKVWTDELKLAFKGYCDSKGLRNVDFARAGEILAAKGVTKDRLRRNGIRAYLYSGVALA